MLRSEDSSFLEGVRGKWLPWKNGPQAEEDQEPEAHWPDWGTEEP